MAIVEVKVPQLSESVAEATLLQWKKKVGESVAADEILIEVETDKVVLEVPAPAAGVLAELVAPDGATVAAEQLIARIDTEGKASASASPPAATAAPAAAQPAAQPAATAAIAMPAAAKLMADNAMPAGSVPGTGKDGRITKADALAYVDRLNGIGAALDQNIAVSNERAKDGVLPPKWVFPFVISDAQNIIKGAPFDSGPDSALYADLKSKVSKLDITQADKDAIIASGAKALLTSVAAARRSPASRCR